MRVTSKTINIPFMLERYNGSQSRYTCPSCGQANEFTKYINSETSEYVGDDVGICNRKNKCGYHKPPREHFQEKKIFSPKPSAEPSNLPVSKPSTSSINKEVIKATMQQYERNNLFRYITSLLKSTEEAEKLFRKYNVGTSKKWNGSTVFWQQDRFGKFRTGKIMLYNGETGKRVKEPYNHISWTHKEMDIPNFSLDQCLFGEHLLAVENKPVALVESEKTALICSYFLPEYTWLATGGFDNFSVKMCRPLMKKTIHVFPDAGYFQEWKNKAALLQNLLFCKFIFNEYIENAFKKGNVAHGDDLVDCLTRQE